MEIQIDDPRKTEVARLLREHLDDMAMHSPAESIHALDTDALCAPEVTFWTARRGCELLGCAALLKLDRDHGEVKSMRTAASHLREGVAAALLQHLIGEARQRSYSRLSLETGSMEAFAPARALYGRFGFVVCGPFANYALDPNSVFMTLSLCAPESSIPED